ncbi:MAG: methionyl-tRNA formyltransferase [Bacteroidetes bacterium]|nr:methionyl-tRNA formyltransferase [Bacteroidota bacterium]
MGTPEIAVESLKAIVNQGFNVVGVVTAPDKPAGRGQKLKYSAVKEYALQNDLLLLQPSNLKDANFIEQLKELNPDVQVVVAFRMLPKLVWEIPSKGTFNMHASLLPDLRGAAPINWAVIYGYKKTGVTTFFINEEIDKGKIILSREIDIEEGETAGSLHDKLMIIGANIVVDTLSLIQDNSVETFCQADLEKNISVLKPAPKIYKEDCKIDWNKQGREIVNFVNGLNPYPGAYALLNINPNIGEANYKIIAVAYLLENHDLSIGDVITDRKNHIKVAIKDGFIEILSIQEPGKRLLSTKEYLRGVKF